MIKCEIEEWYNGKRHEMKRSGGFNLVCYGHYFVLINLF